MAIIYSYPKNTDILSTDVIVGSSTRVVNGKRKNITKTFEVGTIAEFYNETSSIAITGQNNFFFQKNIAPGRKPGSISFINGGGSGTNFSSITTIRISKKATSGNLVIDYISTFVDQAIIIAQVDNLNNFGIYKFISITQSITEPDFYDIVIEMVNANGSIQEDKFYGFAVYPGFVNPDMGNGSGIDKTSQLINDGSDGTSTYVETDELGTTAFSNDYNDLDNLPTIPEAVTKTSDLINDGEDGVNPFITLSDIDLSSKLDKDFSSLPNATTPLLGSEELAIIQDGETKKVATSNVGFQFPTTSSIIYGVENSLARRIDTLLADNYISATVVNSGTTLANIGSFFGGSFSQGTHTAYGSLLSTIPASKIVSATASGSTAGYRQQVMRGIVNTLRSKVKTETYFSIANTIAPTSSRASIGYTTYALPPGNYNPSVTSILSFCNDDGDDYLKLCHRDTSGVVQSISLGTQFPARFSNQEHVYQCCFYLLGNHQGMATIRDLITGEYYESPVIEVYQINNNGFWFSVFMNNNITAEAVEPIFVGQVNKLIYGI